MPSITHIVQAGVAFAGLVASLPAQPKLNARALRLYDVSTRQAAAAPLTDIDILQLCVIISETSSITNTLPVR